MRSFHINDVSMKLWNKLYTDVKVMSIVPFKVYIKQCSSTCSDYLEYPYVYYNVIISVAYFIQCLLILVTNNNE